MTIPALLASLLVAACATTPSEPPSEPAVTAPAQTAFTAGVEGIYRQGLAAAEAGDLEGALAFLERATAGAPDELRYGAEYRQVAIEAEAYDRSIDFFESLAKEHPESPEVRLQWGYAYVDKIPAAGAVTAVILANSALDRFTESIEREETWLALYTRGNSYVYWPPIFGRTELGIADLEKAVARSEELEVTPPFHAHAYAALGDAHWRLEDLETAAETWRRGLERVPGASFLQERLDRLEEGSEALDEYLQAHYEIGNRVDTSLRELWSDP
jgi:tetratricopeptide (TPR) repeat protein